MVWGGDIVASSQRSSRSNVDLEIGCLVDLAMGMLSFSANGKELGTCYQVGVASGAELLLWALGFGLWAWASNILHFLPPYSSSPNHLVSPCGKLVIRLGNKQEQSDCILYREKYMYLLGDFYILVIPQDETAASLY